jgi:hypothetical protein
MLLSVKFASTSSAGFVLVLGVNTDRHQAAIISATDFKLMFLLMVQQLKRLESNSRDTFIIISASMLTIDL